MLYLETPAYCYNVRTKYLSVVQEPLDTNGLQEYNAFIALIFLNIALITADYHDLIIAFLNALVTGSRITTVYARVQFLSIAFTFSHQMNHHPIWMKILFKLS